MFDVDRHVPSGTFLQYVFLRRVKVLLDAFSISETVRRIEVFRATGDSQGRIS
jgi:hypothetical protein